MFDAPARDTDQPDMPLSRALQLQCRALAAVPHEFRAVGTWLNYNCAVIPGIENAEERARLFDDMKKARAALDTVMPYFSFDSTLPDFHPDAVAWFRDCLKKSPKQAEPFRRMAQMLRSVQEVVETDTARAAARQRALSAYILKDLAPEIIALLDILDTALEQQERQRQEWAEKMRKEADDAVARIQTISQMVRLISLNASVEASRAGDAGKAFGVIAHEVKALSESIRASAGKVTGTVHALTERL
ncbi:MAG: methyl-accepting chemotaxis protein [Pseudomonadota bacterium]